jgi:TonB family protein
MNKPIKNISLKFSCQANWSEMADLGDCRFCSQCNKKVYDFTEESEDAFLTTLAENNGSVCGRYTRDQLSPVFKNHTKWLKWLSAVAFFVGISTFAEQAHAQSEPLTIKEKQKSPVNAGAEMIFGGLDGVTPSFPGGVDSLSRFLSKNIRWENGMKNGRVIAGFTVGRDGCLTDIKILRGVGTQNDEEVLRVLQLMPKWRPGIQNGRPVRVSYSIPVNFNPGK